jgi:hypothetical protein
MVRDQGDDPDTYPLTIVVDPDIALLNYWIYCELFHHNVDQILSVSARTAPAPKPLGLKIRRRWVAYCMPDVNNHRNRKWNEIEDFEQLSQTHMWDSCPAFTRREMALLRFFESGLLQEYSADEPVQGRTYPSDYDPWTAEQRIERIDACIDMAQHLGVESLRMLLPRGLYQARARLEEIKQSVDVMSSADMESLREEDALRMGISISGDCHEGIYTNMMSDEELADQLTRWEADDI